MDDITFDRFARSFSAGPSRRTILGLLASATFGRVADLASQEEAGARGKKKGGTKKKGKKHHKKKKKRDEPKGKPCGDGFCNESQCCYLGHCIDKNLCCVRDGDCNACSHCENGLCVADPTKEGKACNGCLECVNGACGIPNRDFCPDPGDQQCRPNGECCPTCVNDKCCSAREACINPGPFNDNFCCDKVANQPCGANGDGTFKGCCNPRTEECVDGQCQLKPACEGIVTAQGQCCPEGTIPCSGPSGPFCAPAGHACCGDASCDSSQVCCDPSQGHCCASGACVAGQCCPAGRTVCDGECVDTQTDRHHCRRCGWNCDFPGFDCCAGSCTNLMNDEEHCGACGNVCDVRTQACVDGQCHDICSLNTEYTVACDDGVDYWCCPERSPQCCRLSGNPHCC